MQEYFREAENLFSELHYRPIEFSYLRQFQNWFNSLLILAKDFYDFHLSFQSMFLPAQLYENFPHRNSVMLAQNGGNIPQMQLQQQQQYNNRVRIRNEGRMNNGENHQQHHHGHHHQDFSHRNLQ